MQSNHFLLVFFSLCHVAASATEVVLLQLPTQIYMAVLYAVQDLLLNFQHCWYNYVLKPRQQRKQQQLEAQRQRAVTPGHSSDSTSNVANQQAEKLQHAPPAVTADVQPPVSSFHVSTIPAAHQLRALSAGWQLVQILFPDTQRF